MTIEEFYLTTTYAAAVSGKPCGDFPQDLDWVKLYSLALSHGITGALYYAVKDANVPEEYAEKFKAEHETAVERDKTRAEEEERVFAAFDKADISYLPLKGSILRLYYPSADMRAMGDTDVMVEQYARKDARAVMESCGYKHNGTQGNKDIYKNDGGNVYELHYKPADMSEFHKKLMERALAVNDKGSRLSLSYNDFYVYMVSNLANMVKTAKATLRMFADFKVFYSRCGSKLDEKHVASTLQELGLADFESAVKKLTHTLFYGAEADSDTAAFSAYVLALGVATTKEQRKENKKLLTKLGLTYNKNGKQKMTGSDIAVTVSIIAVLVFAIGFISLAFFQKGNVRTESEDSNESDAVLYSGEEISTEEGEFTPPKQESAVIPFRNGVYKGTVTNGLPNGAGELILPNGERYIGHFADGMYNGKGVYYYLNGTSYDGMWFENEINGTGVLTLEDGSSIVGDFINGIPQGVCTYQYANGDVYEGVLTDGKRTGKGKFTGANGIVYEGDYVEGRMEGFGKCVYADGSSYEGQWIDGVPNGKGTLVTKQFTRTGVFIQGLLEGQGKSVSKSGDVYEGEFVHGKCNDTDAVFTFKDGCKYVGAFENDKQNGKGVFTYTNGDTVTGTFKDGLLQGKAKYYYKSSRTTKYITYKDGKPV